MKRQETEEQMVVRTGWVALSIFAVVFLVVVLVESYVRGGWQ